MNKKLKIVLSALANFSASEFDELSTILSDEYGIQEKGKPELNEFHPREKIFPINTPTVEILPIDKPKKIKHFVPKNIGKSVKCSQKTIYRQRRY